MQGLRRLSFALCAATIVMTMPVLAQQPPPEAPAPMLAPPPGEPVEWEEEDFDTPPPLVPGDMDLLRHGPALAPGPRAELSGDDEKAAVDFLRQESPEIAASLQELKKSAPDAYRRQVRAALADKRELDRLKQRHPERYETARREKTLERQSRFLARKHANAKTAEERGLIRAELSTVLDEAFDLRESRREQMIERLEKELAELRQTTQKRQENKGQIVSRRIEELLGRDDDLRW